MFDLHDLLLFLGAGLALNLTPGPDMLYVAARGTGEGRRAGVVSALGIGAGTLFHIAALALGLSAPAAFRFSFLLSLPAVAGAALLELGDSAVLQGFSALAWLAAGLAFVCGYLALLLLRGLLVRGQFWLFGLYLVPLGAAMLLWDLLGAR